MARPPIIWTDEMLDDLETYYPITRDEILAEYNEVLSRSKFGLEKETVEAVVSELLKHSLNVDAPSNGVVLPDPKDVVFYNVVLAKRDDGAYLVTGNTKHFPACGFVVTPREFLDIVDGPLRTMFVSDFSHRYRP